MTVFTSGPMGTWSVILIKQADRGSGRVLVWSTLPGVIMPGLSGWEKFSFLPGNVYTPKVDSFLCKKVWVIRNGF